MKRFLRLALAALAFAPLLAAAPAGKRLITENDVLKFRWVADPEISPDGTQVAYVLVTVNEKEDRAPRWSPDGRTIAFLRSEEKGPAQIHLLAMTGGEANLPASGTSATSTCWIRPARDWRG